MLNTEKVHITCVSLLAACTCNLDCEYCLIAKSSKSNKNSHKIMVENTKALEDGTYLKNVLTVLDRLGQSRLQINSFQIWGQEPTLVLPHITNHFEAWYEAFPNMNYAMFSTNGMEYPERIFDWFVKIDDTVDHPFQVDVQVSYDGEFGVNNVRGGKSNVILENFVKLNEMLNGHLFKHIKIHLTGHGVLSFKLLHQLKTFDDIDALATDIDNFIGTLTDTSLNRAVEWTPLGLQYQSASEASVEDGLQFAEVIRMVERHYRQTKHPYYDHSPGFRIEAGGAFIVMIYGFIKDLGLKSLDEFIHYVIDNKTAPMHERMFCGAVVNDLKIMYDGTPLLCQNFLFDTDINKDNLKDTIYDHSKVHFMERYHKVNFVTDSDEDVQRELDFVTSMGRANTTMCMINQNVNMLYMLAKCGQVDASYLIDEKKLLTHAVLLSLFDVCYANLLYMSGSIAIRNTSFARFMCNGVMDMVVEAIEESLRIGQEPSWQKFNNKPRRYGCGGECNCEEGRR